MWTWLNIRARISHHGHGVFPTYRSDLCSLYCSPQQGTFLGDCLLSGATTASVGEKTFPSFGGSVVATPIRLLDLLLALRLRLYFHMQISCFGPTKPVREVTKGATNGITSEVRLDEAEAHLTKGS